MNDIVGILLAAGFSRRFGHQDKLTHVLPNGDAVAVSAAKHLIEAIPTSIAVVRPTSVALMQALTAMGYQLVLCSEQEQLMADSLTNGIRAAAQLANPASGYVIALADMPYIQPATMLSVSEALRERQGIVMPTYLGQRGHPVGFSVSFRDELEALTGDEGARAVIKRHPEQVHLLPTEDAGILMDIDVPSDLLRQHQT